VQATTSIDVFVVSTDYLCCGVPFAVGDRVAFALSASEDADYDPEARLTFVDIRHPPESGPQPREVDGIVERVTGRWERMIPVAGAHYQTADPNDWVECDVQEVPAKDHPEGYDYPTYRVRLRVAADAPLPAESIFAALPLPTLGSDDSRVGPTHLLTAVVEEASRQFPSAIQILRDHSDAAVTLQPHRPNAAAVRWNAWDGELSVEVEYAQWTFPWNAEGASSLRDLVEAVATGGFTETIEGSRFVSFVRTPEGNVYTATAEAPDFSAGGPIVLPEPTAGRFRRVKSGVSFEPW
jgi:hypothetical protein